MEMKKMGGTEPLDDENELGLVDASYVKDLLGGQIHSGGSHVILEVYYPDDCSNPCGSNQQSDDQSSSPIEEAKVSSCKKRKIITNQCQSPTQCQRKKTTNENVICKNNDDKKQHSNRNRKSSDLHIRSAISVHPSYFEAGENEDKYFPQYSCPRDGQLLEDDALHDAIARLGIHSDTLVVVYGKGDSPPMIACRVVWALMYAGVRRVRFLDGGFDEFQAHFPSEVVSSPSTISPVESFDSESVAASSDFVSIKDSDTASTHISSASSLVRKHILATSTQVQQVSQRAIPGKLVDCRALGEHEGWFKTQYPFFSIAGHIPSCVYAGNWDRLIDETSGKLKTLKEIEERWLALGLSKEDGPLIFYCGTGWRSSIAFVLAHLLGWDTKNYDGGWYEWSCGGPTAESA